MSVEHTITRKIKQRPSFRPVILNLRKNSSLRLFGRLLNSTKNVTDDYVEQLKELYSIKNPSEVYLPDFADKFEKYLKRSTRRIPLYRQGRWIFYPWLFTLVHLLEDKDFQLVRTARNRELINRKEQGKFYNSVIGVAGQSVGNSVALAIVLQGGAKHLRLADHDHLALSNLNRIRAGVDNLGIKKVEMTARQIYLLNPYGKIDTFPEGLTKKNIKKFFYGPPVLDIVVDEVDNLAVKYLIREEAKRLGIAVLMGADCGDNAIVDVERYDFNKNTKFFHGRIGKVTYNHLAKMDKIQTGKTIVQHIGSENLTNRITESMGKIGKELVSWPQLGGAALINGSALAYCVRKILNDQSLIGKRGVISLDEKLNP